jgi:HAD superfamily hydrolase (TIGR01459 family)
VLRAISSLNRIPLERIARQETAHDMGQGQAAPRAHAGVEEGALSEIALVEGLGSLASRYELILCDVWGVLHNGLVAFAPASEALTRFRAAGGRVVLVSNAPRPGSDVAAQLDRIAVPRTAWDAIVTSGDLTRAAVIERKGQTVHHLGPERDHAIFAGLDVEFGDVDSADYVVCSGFHDDDHETVEDYRDVLRRMRERDLWMICANPDLVVERGDRLVPCAGALALAYEEIGGSVFYAGKPHRPIYEAALAVAANLRGGQAVASSRVLAIGDAMRTDIAGAAAFGIHSLFVARGIHAAELGLEDGPLEAVRVRSWLTGQECRPHGFCEELVWL